MVSKSFKEHSISFCIQSIVATVYDVINGNYVINYARKEYIIFYKSFNILVSWLLGQHFENSLNENLANNTEFDRNSFEEIVLSLLSSPAPFKKRMILANLRVFINKKIHKAIMVRSRLRNKFLKEKTVLSKQKHIINKETTALN